VTALTIKRLVHAVTEYSLEQINDGYRDMLEGRNIRGVIRFTDADRA
jgi:Zn-dependent alcohol dehydrogenase